MIFTFRIPKWSKISVEMYQYINDINDSEMNETDKLLMTLTALTGKTERQLDKLGMSKLGMLRFTLLVNRLKKRLKVLAVKGKPVQKLSGFKFIGDVERLTFGKYIEIQHFFKLGQVESLHFVAASMCENEDISHQQRAARILQLPFLPVFWTVVNMLEQLTAFNNEYKGLLGIDEEVDEELKPEQNKFNERYGWIYSAKKVADFNNISIDQVMDFPVRQAFNYLACIKELNNYEYELNKKQLGGIINH
jgi:hypothetical protein